MEWYTLELETSILCSTFPSFLIHLFINLPLLDVTIPSRPPLDDILEFQEIELWIKAPFLPHTFICWQVESLVTCWYFLRIVLDCRLTKAYALPCFRCFLLFKYGHLIDKEFVFYKIPMLACHDPGLWIALWDNGNERSSLKGALRNLKLVDETVLNLKCVCNWSTHFIE